MAIEFVGARTSSRTGAASGTATHYIGGGLTGGSRGNAIAGDLVIAIYATVSTSDRSLAITDGSADYTLLGSELYANDDVDVNFRAAYKFMGATPDSLVYYGPTGSINEPGMRATLVYSGVDPATPLDVSVQTATGTNGCLADPPSITPVTAGALIVCAGAGSQPIGTITNFSSADLTNFATGNSYSVNPFRENVVLGAGHKTDWASGAFDAAAFTGPSTTTALAWTAMSLALRPAPDTAGGQIKVWNGSSFVAKPLKVWNGSAWVTKPLKVWNGSAWVATSY